MEVKELRIGNYVQDYNDRLIVVNEYTILNFDIYSKNQNEALIPIPLTEEWLLKFGFEKDGVLDCYNEDIERQIYGGFNINTISLVMMDGYLLPKPYYDSEAFSEDFKLSHVHQLQNLYFALTGEELIINNI